MALIGILLGLSLVYFFGPGLRIEGKATLMANIFAAFFGGCIGGFSADYLLAKRKGFS